MNPAGASSVIDAHVHVWPAPRPVRPYPWTPDPHPVDALLPVLDGSGVAQAIQVTPTIMEFDNDYGLEAAASHPGRISVFGRFDPSPPDLGGRLGAWMRQPGAAGIRLTFFGESAAAPGQLLALAPLWEECEAQAVAVAVFAPDALGELTQVAVKFPRLRLLVDHLGLGVYEGSVDPFAGWKHLGGLADLTGAHVKISTLVEASAEPFPFRDVHDRLAEAVELFGVERLIWGSNYPVVLNKCGYRESLGFLAECSFLRPADIEWLTHRAVTSYLSTATGTGGRA